MKKIFSRKHFKKGLALLLAVSMVFTTNVFGMDIVAAAEENTEAEFPSYRVLKLSDEASLEAVKENQELLWDESDTGYGTLWDETYTLTALDEYLASDGTEYVVLQQVTQSSHQAPNKKLVLPENIKGALLVPDWDEDAEAVWLLNELRIQGSETCVYLYDLVIDTEGSEELTIDFTGTNITDTGLNKKVVFKHSVINAPINCDSTSGTISFLEDNILSGYSVKCKTEFREAEGYDYVDLLINGDAGISFDDIIGDMDVSIVYNGYPQNPESLPQFNKEIFLGTTIDNVKVSKDVTVNFWQYKELPFWLDDSIAEDEEWWEAVPAVNLEAGTQVAYFAGNTEEEKELVGRHVLYSAHGIENNLQINPVTGILEEANWEEPSYRILKLEANDFEKATEDPDRIWNEDLYGDLWEDTNNLDEYLGSDGIEYVVIQATQASHNSENKSLELPANIKGAILVADWDEEADAAVEWQLDELRIQGADTGVYLYDLVIDTAGNEQFTVDFSAAGNHASKAVFKNIAVNAQIHCDSAAGTIGFLENNILTGYSVKCETEFHEYGNLMINGSAGISFEGITGDTDPQIIFNGYPQNPESLPHFNKEINLGTGTDEEGNEYNRGINICVWQYKETPFWLDGTEEWWEAVPAEKLEAGTQIAYFAGVTNAEKERIGCKVFYYAHGTENNLHINSHTGRLEEDGTEPEKAAYAVIKLDSAASFAEIKENSELIWDENSYGASWDGTDDLDEYLRSDGMEYVVIQATRASHNSENKRLELPENIKGAVLVSDMDKEALARVEWQLDTLIAKGEKEIIIDYVSIFPSKQKLSIAAEAGPVKIDCVGSGIVGSLELSGSVDITFRRSNVFGDINAVDGKAAIGLEGRLLADGLSGYSKLNVYGDAMFVVRNPKTVVIENCEFIKDKEGEQGFNLVYNGYPKETSALPVFKDHIVTPENYGIHLRFVQRDDKAFWNKVNWLEQASDEVLSLGTQIAQADITDEQFESLTQSFWYYTKQGENEQNTIKLVRDQAGRVLIQRQNPDTGKQIVDFELSAVKEKEYDGTAFVISNDSITNHCGYTGSAELAWESKSGTPLTEAPKDAGEYVLKISVPENVEEYEGCSRIDFKITARTVTVRLKPDATETGKDPVGFEIIWTGFINGDTYLKQAEVVQGPETTDAAGKYYTLGTQGGDAGNNYVITHAEPVRISIIEDTEPEDMKPRINSVLFPKKQAQYSAVYTGEQIRPVMVVAYQYSDEKGRAKTQNLKLNVDYTVSYTNNVNAGTNTAKVTVKGIGEYAGVITKEFSITKKSIKNVTLSPVGDILHGDTPTVTVLDGTYELVEGEDYKINLSTEGSATADTQCVLTVTGTGNYEGTSKKSVKFNILKEATATSTEIKSIASDSVTVEFKKLPTKGYTYSGKANKPAVVVKDGGVKVPASQYKVVYTNNVNAGTQTASVRVVGVSKKGKGYYGISKELKFDIKQKDFSKVSVSSIAARPKSGSLDYITMTVKDGKRILTEGKDYTVDYSKIVNKDGSLENIVIGQKYALTLKPVSGGNYTDSSSKTVYVKFGQLNLASKTAAVSVKITDAAQNKVEVMYNGTLLKENTDYTAQVKQDKKKSTYTVTIKAVKKSAYKGKRVIKNLTAESGQ